MSKGWVYILSNPAMPGLVKIGKTTRSVEQRMEELYQSGVPQRFVCEHSEFMPDCHEAEKEMHDAFSEFRLDPGREFFRYDSESLKTITSELYYLLRNQVEELVDEFMPDYVVRRPELIVDEDDVSNVASEIGIQSVYVASSFYYIDRDAVAEACKKVEEKIMARKEKNALV